MRKDLIRGALAVLTFTVLLGLAYPLLITGIAQVVFPGKADGDRSLIAKPYQRPVLRPDGRPEEDEKGEPVTEADPRYFQPRPSQSGWSAEATFFSNRGPNQSSARYFYRDRLAAYLALEGRYNPGLENADVPQDAVTTSGSGIDPHISPDNAEIQARRVADVRSLPLGRVMDLVDEHTAGRALGLFGEPGVNVVDLNTALDEEAR